MSEDGLRSLERAARDVDTDDGNLMAFMDNVVETFRRLSARIDALETRATENV